MRSFLLSGVALLAFGGIADAMVIVTNPSPFSTNAATSALIAAPVLTGMGATGVATVNGGATQSTGVFGPAGHVGGLLGGTVGFTTPFTGNVTVSINDCCLVGDVYQAEIDGVSLLGQTSYASTSGLVNSSGSFTISLAAGPHSLGIEDITQSWEGSTASPYGPVPGPVGGPGNRYDPAGLSYGISLEAPVSTTPEPMSLAMLGAGLVGLGAVRRLRKRK